MRRLVYLLVLMGVVLPALAAPPNPSPTPRRTHMQRAVLLEATRNTRDLGGLPTRNGFIRDGLVYRSGALCFLTEADVATMQALKLSTVLELRVDSEINKDGPDRLALTSSIPHHLRLPMSSSRGRGAEAYAVLLEENRQAIRGFFELLANRRSLPLLFHCSAGKDRTGILTALLLESLGTPREVILDDYMQSVRNSPGLVVHPEWLEMVFRVVDGAGGIEAFLKSKGVPAQIPEAIRQNIEEPVER
ncbi:MAG: tyrosine-protein phosphatase [Candidatus Xenobium sp.]|jgi:protein-tyrosine phosphatase|nr:tyrosine-protein phosphatase [Burkholderiales bacterium]